MHLAMENDKINKKKLYLKTRSARWYMTIYRQVNQVSLQELIITQVI